VLSLFKPKWRILKNINFSFEVFILVGADIGIFYFGIHKQRSTYHHKTYRSTHVSGLRQHPYTLSPLFITIDHESPNAVKLHFIIWPLFEFKILVRIKNSLYSVLKMLSRTTMHGSCFNQVQHIHSNDHPEYFAQIAPVSSDKVQIQREDSSRS